jgi:hypothetical protein
LGYCTHSTLLVGSFLLSLVTGNTPSDKTALLKNLRVKFGKCLLQCRTHSFLQFCPPICYVIQG